MCFANYLMFPVSGWSKWLCGWLKQLFHGNGISCAWQRLTTKQSNSNSVVTSGYFLFLCILLLEAQVLQSRCIIIRTNIRLLWTKVIPRLMRFASYWRGMLASQTNKRGLIRLWLSLTIFYMGVIMYHLSDTYRRVLLVGILKDIIWRHHLDLDQ